MNVNIHDFPLLFGDTFAQHDELQDTIEDITRHYFNTTEIRNIKVHRFDEDTEIMNSGNFEFIILINATRGKEVVSCYPRTIFNELEVSRFLSPTNYYNTTPSNGTVIYENERPVAEVYEDRLYILIDLFTNEQFESAKESQINVYKNILHRATQIINEKNKPAKFWSENRNKITNEVESYLTKVKERKIEEDKSDIDRYKTQIDDLKVRLNECHQSLNKKRLEVKANQENTDKLKDSFVNELDNIQSLTKIQDIGYNRRTDQFSIYTNHLNIYDDKNDALYKGGEFTITIHLDESNVSIDSDNQRKGYFSHADPHPHVDGHNLNPCFGSLDTTIAELSSQYEIYALVIMILDYIESVNTEDIAGISIKAWDRIDEDGYIIQRGIEEPGEDEIECDCCGDIVHLDDSITAFESIEMNSDGDVIETMGEQRICERCEERYEVIETDINGTFLVEAT